MMPRCVLPELHRRCGYHERYGGSGNLLYFLLLFSTPPVPSCGAESENTVWSSQEDKPTHLQWKRPQQGAPAESRLMAWDLMPSREVANGIRPSAPPGLEESKQVKPALIPDRQMRVALMKCMRGEEITAAMNPIPRGSTVNNTPADEHSWPGRVTPPTTPGDGSLT
ncbi:unnamed protein product [Boreogadus saida]